MKKLFLILLLCLTTSAIAQFQQKPMLGLQINWTQSISKGLVECGPFNEGSGNIVQDLSGNGNTGTFVGTTNWLPGQFGTSVNVDGDSDYIDFGTSNFGLDLTNEFTIIIGFAADTIADTEVLLAKGEYLYPFLIRFEGNDDIEFGTRTDGGTDYAVTTSAIISIGSQFSVACVFKNETNGKKIYINGILHKELTHAGTLSFGTTQATQMGYGIKGTLGGYFDGRFEYLMIYNRALSVSEIVLLYREPFCMFKPSWNWMLYGAIGIPTAGGQIIMINMN